MSVCSEIRELLPVVPELVTPEEHQRVMRHLEECPECRSLQRDLLLLDRASAEIVVPDPGEEYWDYFALQVQQKVSAARGRERSRIVEWIIHRPTFSWPAAAAALVLVFFMTRAMIPDGEIPESTPVVQTDLSPKARTADVGPAFTSQTPGEESVSIETRSEPEELAVTDDFSGRQVPEIAANDIPPQPTTERVEGRAPSYDPGEVPAEELQSVLAARERNVAQADLPERKTMILRGDTTEAALSDKGLPEGRALELAERPNAPFPGDETEDTAEAQRVLGSQMGQDYTGFDRSYPALNKDDFTADDREFFEQYIKDLTEELSEKMSARKRRKLCHQLVDMYYHLAINWKVEADIEAAQEYIEEARDILHEEDHADLDAKSGALKSLLDE